MYLKVHDLPPKIWPPWLLCLAELVRALHWLHVFCGLQAGRMNKLKRTERKNVDGTELIKCYIRI